MSIVSETNVKQTYFSSQIQSLCSQQSFFGSLRSKPVLHPFHIRWTFVLRWIFRFMFQIMFYTGNTEDFLLGHVIFAVWVLFCFTFVSCLMAIRFLIASPLFTVEHSLHIRLTGVETFLLQKPTFPWSKNWHSEKTSFQYMLLLLAVYFRPVIFSNVEGISIIYRWV